MAERAQPLRPGPGVGAALLVAALILGTLGTVAGRADWRAWALAPADLAALRFTLVQAVLSALLSVGFAIPVARALARRRFVGRRLLVALLGAPFILPVIVATLGLITVFGRAGWVNMALDWAGLPGVRIYGLHGVVMAHVFFNMPLATRLILQGWQEIPAERFRLAAQLGLSGPALFRLIEVPLLMRVVPGALAVVFAVCLSSFAVALILGGGPRATTIELAIYQAFRFDFDLGRAALLAAMQLGLTVMAAALALWLARGDGFGTGLDRSLHRWDGQTRAARMLDGTVIMLAAGFLLLPLLAVILTGVSGLADLPASVARAALTSVGVAAGSTLLTLGLALPMAAAIALGRGRMIEIAGLLGLAASPLVVGTGLFIAIRPFASPQDLALPVTAGVNALLVLPFALRILVPGARDVIARQGRLAVALGMPPWAFARHVFLPRLAPQIGFAGGLAAALSMGDLGVITLFADPGTATLPLQIYALMGAYRTDAAAAAAVLLLGLSFGAFWLLDRGGRRHAEA